MSIKFTVPIRATTVLPELPNEEDGSGGGVSVDKLTHECGNSIGII